MKKYFLLINIFFFQKPVQECGSVFVGRDWKKSKNVMPFNTASFAVFAHVLDSQLFEFVSLSVSVHTNFVILFGKGKIFKLSIVSQTR